MSPPPIPEGPPGRRTQADKILDEQPERRAVNHPGVDGADQPAPRRSATLTGMPAPHRKVPSPWSKTELRPAPPSTVALAVRSDPPPPSGSPERIEATERTPDPSADLRRQLAEAQAQIDRLQRPAFPPPVSERPARVPAPPASPSTMPPSGWSDPRLVKAVIALLAALTPAATAMGIWLTVKATAAERAQERQAEVAKDATATASSAKAQSRDAAKELDELKQQLAAQDAYNRAILRKLGVEYPASKREPAEPTLETQTPRRKPGSVTQQPVLVVVSPPPP